MSPRTGRPKSDTPKDIQLKIRADAETIRKLTECCAKSHSTKSEVIRRGIDEQYEHWCTEPVKKK